MSLSKETLSWIERNLGNDKNLKDVISLLKKELPEHGAYLQQKYDQARIDGKYDEIWSDVVTIVKNYSDNGESTIYPNTKGDGNTPIAIQLRGEKFTKAILDMMTANLLLSFFEHKLSQSTRYWEQSGIRPPADTESYVWHFFMAQSSFYRMLADKITSNDIFHFEAEFNNYNDLIVRRNELLISLCGDEQDNELFSQLSKFGNKLKQLRKEFVSASESHLVSDIRAKLLVELTPLRKLLISLSKEAMDTIKRS